MSSLPAFSISVVVIGAGALGLCSAFELSRRGYAVTVIDAGVGNASQVAAGMIAPAMESAIDDLSAPVAKVLRAGRDLWPDFAKVAGVTLAHRLAEWRGEPVDALEQRLKALGFRYQRDGDRLETLEDYQVDPEQALGALRQALAGAVIEARVERLEAGSPDGSGWIVHAGGKAYAADKVILATGVAEPVDGLPEATARLVAQIEPIRGQIGRSASCLVAHVVRGPGAYAAPMGDGMVIGATMEPGRRDAEPDPETGKRLCESASRILGQGVDSDRLEWRAGVRGASPDGLPMAGAAPDAGLFLAVGPRRNGWLLGPLVAQAVADAVEGRSASGLFERLVPDRF